MKTAAVLGASGYGGGELIRFLDGHPEFRVDVLTAYANVDVPLSAVHPQLGGGDRVLTAFDPDACDVDVAFLAMPHGASAEPAMTLLERGIPVVDLGSDFRLDTPERYLAAYGTQHPFPDQLGAWVYGLPELNADAITASDRVAAPGCYPTSVIVPLAPLLADGLVEPTGIIADSMSGVSGAGRATTEGLRFGAIDESVKAYKVFEHRHQPEIRQVLGGVAGADVAVVFTPHLVPMQRGILSTIHATVTPGTTLADVEASFDTFAEKQPFVTRSTVPPETRWLVGSNNLMASFHLDADSDHLIVLAAIDNLVKGAAGQGVQCANLMFGFDQATGLPTDGWMP
ncbi:MAG: N-acetyl-gamma-glutamyl-phosphate reductase [Acidimicrobiia bacterium]|nr:N-acetyl-gamma-glutamyl-phosphate reductase [Acidimicrobiia bacterium]